MARGEGNRMWSRVDDLLKSVYTQKRTNFSPHRIYQQALTRPSSKNLTAQKSSNSLLSTVLIFLATLSIGGGFIMGIVSFVAGLFGIGMIYILGGAIGAILWYTLYILLTKNR